MPTYPSRREIKQRVARINRNRTHECAHAFQRYIRKFRGFSLSFLTVSSNMGDCSESRPFIAAFHRAAKKGSETERGLHARRNCKNLESSSIETWTMNLLKSSIPVERLANYCRALAARDRDRYGREEGLLIPASSPNRNVSVHVRTRPEPFAIPLLLTVDVRLSAGQSSDTLRENRSRNRSQVSMSINVVHSFLELMARLAPSPKKQKASPSKGNAPKRRTPRRIINRALTPFESCWQVFKGFVI